LQGTPHRALITSMSTRTCHPKMQFLRLRSLHIQPRIDLDPHTRHTRILRQHHKRIHAVIQEGLMLQHRTILHLLDPLLRVLQPLSSGQLPCQVQNEDNVERTHSVRSKPGRTVLTRILGPTVTARHLTSWSCAAFVTAYGMLEPPWLIPYTSCQRVVAFVLPVKCRFAQRRNANAGRLWFHGQGRKV
jgi:hypothetical protein